MNDNGSSGIGGKIALFLLVLIPLSVGAYIIAERIAKALTDAQIMLCLGSVFTLTVVTVVIVLLAVFNFVQVRADDLGEVKRLEAMAKLGYGGRLPGAPTVNVLPSGNGYATLPDGVNEGQYQDAVTLQ